MAILPESIILKAKAAQQHPDNWPDFDLGDVDIFCASAPNTPANLLHAGAHEPLTVRGVLGEFDEEGLKRLHSTWDPSTVPRIEIVDVIQFAFGSYGDGTYDLWAAGRAGWFKIVSPSKKYHAMYNDMLEGVRLLYFIVEASEAQERLKIDQLLRSWSVTEKLAGGTEEARRVLRKHRIFLIASILEHKENLDPYDNVVFKYFQKTCPADIKTVTKRLQAPVRPPKDKVQAPLQWEQASPDKSPGDRKRKRDSATPVGTEPKRTKTGTEVAATASRTTRTGTRTTATAPSRAASDAASDTPQTTSRGRRKSSRHLAEHSEEPPTVVDVAMDTDMDMDINEQDADMGQLAVDTNADPEVERSAHKGKSSLRPRASKYVPPPPPQSQDVDDTKASRRRSLAQQNTAPRDSMTEATETTMDAVMSTSRTRRQSARGSQAMMAPSFSSPVDEGIDMSLDNAEAGIDMVETALQIQIPAEFELNKAQPIEPTAKGDVWSCPLDGCMHSVYGASTPDSQRLIKAHYRVHVRDEDTESRLQLVRRMQGPGTPVNRLVTRIQSLSGFPARLARGF